MRDGILVDLDKMEYEKVMVFQEKARSLRISGILPDLLILVEHLPVYTIGRSGGYEHLKTDLSGLQKRGIKVVETDRGGSITFHGPGQIVAYPVLHRDIFCGDPLQYLRMLEEVIIKTLAKYGARGERFSPNTGVWVKQKKVAAIGVACRGPVTTHGFAINVNVDLGYFDMINPCGIIDYGVTSLKELTNNAPGVDEVKKVLIEKFTEIFSINLSANDEILKNRYFA